MMETLHTPLEVMTGITPNRGRTFNSNIPLCLRQDKNKILMMLHAELDNVHKDAKQRCNKERERHRGEHNALTKVKDVNFIVGDFVMVHRAKGKGHKL